MKTIFEIKKIGAHSEETYSLLKFSGVLAEIP